MRSTLLAGIAALGFLTACPGNPANPDAADATDATDVPTDLGAGPDADDAGPPEDVQPASTAHCRYEPVVPTARAGGAVAPAALRAGAAEVPLDLPVGSTLGAYGARADYGGRAGAVDDRRPVIAGEFAPSVGIETIPMARALALAAGDETVVFLTVDLGIADHHVTHDVERALGPAYAGKVVVAVSHTHAGFGHYVASVAYSSAFGRIRSSSYARVVDTLTTAARRAIAAMVPARLGIAHDGAFDPMDRVTRDRREENDDLPRGRNRKDHDLFVLRVDARDGAPIAVVPVFGIHGTVLGPDNGLASTEAPGAVARAVEESFDRPVVVMHLQGAAGDVSPAGSGGIDCTGARHCYNFARLEGVGRLARDSILAAWRRAGAAMGESVALEAVTRTVQLGNDARTFTVRDGGLAYAAFDRRRAADRVIFTPDGGIVSPIDEFNAPHGAALCGDNSDAILSGAQMPNTRGLRPYRSCAMIDVLGPFLAPIADLPFERNRAVCASTRATLSAVRIGDYVFAALPGEPVTLLADRVRALSPYPPERTVVVGYAQGHVGYMLTADDWLRGGYEPATNLWGPLEAEYLTERTAELMALAVSTPREDAASGGLGTDTVAPDTQPLPPPDPAPRAGMVPATLPASLYVRDGVRLAGAQPARAVPRLASAYFAWIGEDPRSGTPRVTLEREGAPGSGAFAAVTRRSGRAVRDQDVLLTWTPDPVRRDGSNPQTHYWVVEWQAVVPWGTAGLDDVEDRAGVPLGRYRFRVEGRGYTLTSEAFEVTAGALVVAPTRTGSTLTISAAYEATRGFRLLDLREPSNRRVPVRRGPVDVELTLASGATRRVAGVAISDVGQVTLDAGADAPDVRRVRVTDRFGNTGDAAL